MIREFFKANRVLICGAATTAAYGAALVIAVCYAGHMSKSVETVDLGLLNTGFGLTALTVGMAYAHKLGLGRHPPSPN